MARPLFAPADAVLEACARALGPQADANPEMACSEMFHWLDRSIADTGPGADTVQALEALVTGPDSEWPGTETEARELVEKARAVLA